MDERVSKALEFASDACKQLISLATGVIALSVTFTREFVGEVGGGVKTLLVLSWLAFLASVVFGIWSLLALTGTLASPEGERRAGIAGARVRVPAGLQVISFLAGLGLVVGFGARVT